MESARSKLSAFPKRGKNSRISRRGRTIGWGSWAISWASWPVRVGKVRGIEVAFNVCQMSKKKLAQKKLAQRNVESFHRKCPRAAVSTRLPEPIAGRDVFYSRICRRGGAVEGNVEVGEVQEIEEG